jgi:hypothetical protein
MEQEASPLADPRMFGQNDNSTAFFDFIYANPRPVFKPDLSSNPQLFMN